MYKIKFLISVIIFTSLLFGTSIIKNQTREIEKKIYNLNKTIHFKEKDLNESQVEFSYLTSPSIIQKKIEHLDFVKYSPMDYSRIYLDMFSFIEIDRKFVTQENNNEEKIKKK